MRTRWLGVMVVLAGCELGSKSLGEDPENSGTEGGSSEGGSSEESGSATSTESTGADVPPMGELISITLHEGVGAVDMARGADDTLVVVGVQGFVPDPETGGTWTDGWIGAFAADGTLQWELAEPLAEADSPQAVATDEAGNIYTLHLDWYLLAGGNNRVVKRDPMGVPLWSAVVDARPGDLAASADGVIVVGLQEDGNGSLAWAQAFDADGESMFERTWANDVDEARSLFYGAARHGDRWIVGGGRGVEHWSSASRAWLLALDDAGETVWDRLLTEPLSTEDVYAIATNGAEIFAIANEGGDSFIERVDADGTSIGRIAVPDIGAPRSIAAASDGSIVVTNALYLDIDDPDACFDGFGPCSSGVRTMGTGAAGTRWVHDTDQCTYAASPVILGNGESVALGSCGDDETVMGLLRYAP